jgi:hypothetical protein
VVSQSHLRIRALSATIWRFTYWKTRKTVRRTQPRCLSAEVAAASDLSAGRRRRLIRAYAAGYFESGFTAHSSIIFGAALRRRCGSGLRLRKRQRPKQPT